jgi:hypothetical protein
MERKKEYEKPKVITYSEDEIMDIIGPAQTCTTGYIPT